jgi:hypothetical protein
MQPVSSLIRGASNKYKDSDDGEPSARSIIQQNHLSRALMGEYAESSHEQKVSRLSQDFNLTAEVIDL